MQAQLKAAGHQEKLNMALTLAVIGLAQKVSKQDPARAALPLSLSQVQERISLSYLIDKMWEVGKSSGNWH